MTIDSQVYEAWPHFEVVGMAPGVAFKHVAGPRLPDGLSLMMLIKRPWLSPDAQIEFIEVRQEYAPIEGTDDLAMIFVDKSGQEPIPNWTPYIGATVYWTTAFGEAS